MGQKVQLHVLSARSYVAGRTTHPSVGMGEFVSSLLSHLVPADALTFIQHRSGFHSILGKRTVTPTATPMVSQIDPKEADSPTGAASTDASSSADASSSVGSGLSAKKKRNK